MLPLRCLCWGAASHLPFSPSGPYVSGSSLGERPCSEAQGGSTALSSGKIFKGDFLGGFLSCKHCLIPV